MAEAFQTEGRLGMCHCKQAEPPGRSESEAVPRVQPRQRDTLPLDVPAKFALNHYDSLTHATRHTHKNSVQREQTPDARIHLRNRRGSAHAVWTRTSGPCVVRPSRALPRCRRSMPHFFPPLKRRFHLRIFPFKNKCKRPR